MDALNDADAALQVHGFGRIRALLAGEIVDRQHGLSRLAQLAEALPDEGQIHGVGVLVVQCTVRHPGVELRAPEEIVQTDHMGRCALPDEFFGQLVGRGGLAAGRRAGEHDDLSAGKADFFGRVADPLAVAALAHLRQRFRAAGGNVIKVDLHQTFRDPNRDHKNQPLLFSVPEPPQSAGCIRSDT